MLLLNRIGSSVRDQSHFTPKPQLENPGPGRYIEKSEFDVKSQGWSFGRDPKLKWAKSETPGPGYYIIHDTIGTEMNSSQGNMSSR